MIYENLKPAYPNENFTKQNKKARMACQSRGRYGILEYGHTAVGFRIACDDTLWRKLDDWWMKQYKLKGEKFLVELFPYNGEVDILFFESKPYYKCKNQESSQDDAENIISLYKEQLPDFINHEGMYTFITDWDYIPSDRFLSETGDEEV